MKSRVLSFCAILISGLICAAQGSSQAAEKEPVRSSLSSLTTSNSISGESLETRISSLIRQPRFAQGQWGIKIVSLDTGKTVYETNATKLMNPASNAKLFTCALALDRLGADYRIKTPVFASAKPDTNGVIHGDLIIQGNGDPCFSARFQGDHASALRPLVAAIQAAGIKKIEGDLVGDESRIPTTFGEGWGWDDLEWAYGAPISALSYDDNATSISVLPGKEPGAPCQILVKSNVLNVVNRTKTTAKGSAQTIDLFRIPGEDTLYVSGGLAIGGLPYTDMISIPHPALSFVTGLSEGLAKQGICVTGRTRTTVMADLPVACSNLVPVATVESKPLGQIVRETLKSSQNQIAQILLVQTGMKTAEKAAHPDEAGLNELKKFIREAGIKPEHIHFKEGSGMGTCLVTADAITDLLSHMARHRCASVFAEALPLAGVDGTLQNRFKNTAAEKRVWAKTGTREFVSAISGYAVTLGNEHLAFSVMLNNYKGASTASARAELDAVVEILVEKPSR